MNKTVSVCPYCHKGIEVEVLTAPGIMQNVRCSHCSKSWSENLNASTELNKRYTPIASDFSALNDRIAALTKVVDGGQAEERRARFVPRFSPPPKSTDPWL